MDRVRLKTRSPQVRVIDRPEAYMSRAPCPARPGGSPHMAPFYLALPFVDLSYPNAYLFLREHISSLNS